jgi:hypothetical protein
MLRRRGKGRCGVGRGPCAYPCWGNRYPTFLRFLSLTVFQEGERAKTVGTTFMASVNSLRGIFAPITEKSLVFPRKWTDMYGFNGVQSPSMN